MNIDKADQNQNSEANLISDKDNQKNLEGNLNKIKKANENYKKSKITVALDDFNNLNIKQKMKILNEQNIHLKDFLKKIKKKNNTKSSLNEKNSEIFKNRKIEKGIFFYILSYFSPIHLKFYIEIYFNHLI